MTVNSGTKGVGMRGVLAVLMIAGLAAQSLASGIPGAILKKDGTRLQGGRIRYVSRSRSYEYTGASGAKSYVPHALVADIAVAKPKKMAYALQQVQREKYSTAIPVLSVIVQDYDNLKWDIPAGANLAKCYLKTGKPSQAVTICERVIRKSPEAAGDVVMAPVFWDALLKTGKTDRLAIVLGKAVAYGDRHMAAIAQIKRGDIMDAKGNTKLALVDGYLRTVLLYRDIPDAQPEALFKAIKAFQKIGRHSDADRLRQTLLAEHPSSSYTRQL